MTTTHNRYCVFFARPDGYELDFYEMVNWLDYYVDMKTFSSGPIWPHYTEYIVIGE